MALDLLNKKLGTRVLDIHAGGVDLIFPHHEDEIAQSCAHTGEADFARGWMHGEFLTMGGTKMSKRFGNFLTARDLQQNHVDAGTVRTLFATTHYRAPADFADASLDAAREGSRRLGEFDSRLRRAEGDGDAGFELAATRLSTDFAAAMNDDLNTPRALAALFEAAREGNRLLDAGEAPGSGFRTAWTTATDVLQVLPDSASSARVTGDTRQATGDLAELAPSGEAEALDWASAWAGRRVAAKAARDWPEADRIRDLLAAAGWEVRDSRDGSAEVVKK
jgi:cysteinyl-tRNA synthetase